MNCSNCVMGCLRFARILPVNMLTVAVDFSFFAPALPHLPRVIGVCVYLCGAPTTEWRSSGDTCCGSTAGIASAAVMLRLMARLSLLVCVPLGGVIGALRGTVLTSYWVHIVKTWLICRARTARKHVVEPFVLSRLSIFDPLPAWCCCKCRVYSRPKKIV